MRVRKKKKNSGQSIHLALLFAGFLAFILLFSLFFKFINLAQESGFDGKHNFILAASFKNSGGLISFSPDNNSISVLILPKNTDIGDLQKTLKIPIDREVSLSKDINLNSKDISTIIKEIFFSKNDSSQNPTLIDFFRLYTFSKTLPQSQVVIKKLGEASDSLNDKIISSLFYDYTISKELLSIQIINATGVEGIGNRLARLVTNSGGNVVAVSTGQKIENKSKIVFFEDSYTIDRLGKVLGFEKEKVKSKESRLSDIIITIGKKSLNSAKF